jgi:hypothetical protein
MATDTLYAKLTTIATLPEHYFLENIAIRGDGSMLVTALNRKELWYVPAPSGTDKVGPILVASLDNHPMSIVETEPDLFYVSTLGVATIERFDLRGWTPGTPAKRTLVLSFDDFNAGLNGSCLLAPNVILVADCAVGLIWRVDLTEDGLAAKASVWLRHESMAPGTDPSQAVRLTQTAGIPYPGVNGVHYAPQGNYVYYTGSWTQSLNRVAVDTVTLEPAGEPEVVADGIHAVDDFVLDEARGVAYITTHIDNTIHRVPLESGSATQDTEHVIVAGDPLDERLLGPSSAAWGRGNADHGRVAYIATDGGHTGPNAAGIIRPAAVVRIELESIPAARDR